MSEKSPISAIGVIRQVTSSSEFLPYLATAFVFLFGLSMIINSHTSADGGWFFYANAMRNGIHLYTDLHSPTQPFFPIEVLFFLNCFGPSWIASLALPTTHLLIFCMGFYFLTKNLNYSSNLRTMLILAGFFCTIQFEFYKFDDFHVITDISILYSSYLFVANYKTQSKNCNNVLSFAIGVISGICFFNRSNDGAVFTAIALFLIIFPLSTRSILRVLALLVGFILSGLFIIIASGDSFHSYLYYAIQGATGIKGGMRHVITSPILIIFDMIIQIVSYGHFQIAIVTGILIYVISKSYIMITSESDRQNIRYKLLFIVGNIILLSWILFNINYQASIITAILPAFLFIIYLCGIYSSAVQLMSPNRWRLASLSLFPMGELISSSMSSGGFVGGLFAPMGMFLLTVPIINRRINHQNIATVSFYFFCFVVIISGAVHKIYNPASWNNYHSGVMFLNKKIIVHKIYGPMIVDKRTDKFFLTICNKIKLNNKYPTMLSLPFSYENYYCGIQPWNWHIQTFFDTSNAETINSLIKQLYINPPEWVLYQRQILELRGHEIIYNYGRPLPHRTLDRVIMNKMKNGEWKLEAEYKEYSDSDWLLLRTQAP